eukprot:COSAG06_NODE_1669_length_8750_cov_35.371736_6_plen_183_part_00
MSGLGEREWGSEREAAAPRRSRSRSRGARARMLCLRASARHCSWHAHCLRRGERRAKAGGCAGEAAGRARWTHCECLTVQMDAATRVCVGGRACVTFLLLPLLVAMLSLLCRAFTSETAATSTIGANDPPTLSLVPWKHKRPIPSKISRKFTSDLPILQTSQTLMRPPHARCPHFPCPLSRP